MLYLGLLMFSYLVFVFISDNLNPFVKVKTHVKRRRWKFGRNVSLAVLISGLSALFFGATRELSLVHQGVVFLLISSILILPIVIGYRRSQLWR